MSELNHQRSDEVFTSASSGAVEVAAPLLPPRASAAPPALPAPVVTPAPPQLMSRQTPDVKSVGIVFGVVVAVTLVIGLHWFEGKPFANLGVIPLVMLLASVAVHLAALTKGKFALAAGALGCIIIRLPLGRRGRRAAP